MARLKDTVEKTMFFGAKPITFERAKELRLNPTEAEVILWEILRNKKMLGIRFKHQHPINKFIADFYCHPLRLVIEVDGEIHNTKENKEYDDNRTVEFESYGITVLRFTNDEVLNNIEMVRSIITSECKKMMQIKLPPHTP
jgi:very-short-patch-repair endonuclease